MLAKNNEYLEEASKTLFQLSADEQIKKRCLDREEYYQDLKAYEKAIAKKDIIIAEKDDIIAKLEAELAQYKNTDSKK